MTDCRRINWAVACCLAWGLLTPIPAHPASSVSTTTPTSSPQDAPAHPASNPAHAEAENHNTSTSTSEESPQTPSSTSAAQDPDTHLPASSTVGLHGPATLRRIQLCGPPLAPPPNAVERSQRAAAQTPWLLWADEITANHLQGLYNLRGQARLKRLDQYLRAENVELDNSTGRAFVPGSFSFSQSGLHIWGDSGRFDLRDDNMTVDNAQFRLYPYYHGAARVLDSTGSATIRIEDLRYTNCPPEAETWLLYAGEMTLNTDAGLAEARHARLEIGGIPWFYIPYIQFPIDNQPQTGLLPPSFGNSNTHGGFFTQPIYLRWAPNYDLTVSPTYYSRRGEKLGTQFRYLQRNLRGAVAAEYMSSDDLFAQQLREEEANSPERQRWSLDWRHSGDLPANIDYGWDIERVSDEHYLRDFSSDLIGGSDTELESTAHAEQSLGNHHWRSELQYWQNLRPETNLEPYHRWPRVTYEHTPSVLPGGFEYRLEAEGIKFELPESAQVQMQEPQPTGERYHLNPRLGWPLRKPAFFIEPALSLHYTRYDIEHLLPQDNPQAEISGAEGELERTIPIASIDAGIFLERPFTLGDTPFLQTLEPRLFYLYAPYKKQDQFPVYDTSERPNTVAQLFEENRFSGIDRISAAKQLTTAITSRINNIAKGSEPLRASIGQIYYFRERKVTLEDDPDPEELTRDRSDIFADAELRLPGGLNLRAEYRHDPYTDDPVATTFTADMQIRPAPRALVNVSYRIREELNEQGPDEEPILERTQDYIEASGVMPINVNWSVIGGWQYSRLERANLEVVGGLEYRSCCWAVRGVARRFRRPTSAGTDNPGTENAIMFEFELTGLGNFGDDSQSFIEQVVPGYGESSF